MKQRKPLPFCERAEDPTYIKEKNLQIDVDYYIGKQILPPILRLFEGMGEQITIPVVKKQKTLDDIINEKERYEKRKKDILVTMYRDETIEVKMRIAEDGTIIKRYDCTRPIGDD